MAIKDLAIFVVAEGISKSVVNRFRKCVQFSCSNLKYDIYVLGNAKKKTDLYKGFNKCKVLNAALRKLKGKEYKVLCQTDIDVIFPPKMLEYGFQRALEGKFLFHNDMMRVNPESDKTFKSLPKTYNQLDWKQYAKRMKKEFIDATGCFNIMQKEYWYETGGWCEDFRAWSREDDYYMECVKKYTDIKIISSHKFPLLHYNHPRRTKDNRRQNDVVRNKYRKKGFVNWL